MHYEKSYLDINELRVVFKVSGPNDVTSRTLEKISLQPDQWIRIRYDYLGPIEGPGLPSPIIRTVMMGSHREGNIEVSTIVYPQGDYWVRGLLHSNFYTQGFRCDVCNALYQSADLAGACERSKVPIPKFVTGDLLQGPRGGYYLVQKVVISPGQIAHHLTYDVRSLLGGLPTSLGETTGVVKISSVEPGIGWKKAAHKLGLIK